MYMYVSVLVSVLVSNLVSALVSALVSVLGWLLYSLAGCYFWASFWADCYFWARTCLLMVSSMLDTMSKHV